MQPSVNTVDKEVDGVQNVLTDSGLAGYVKTPQFDELCMRPSRKFDLSPIESGRYENEPFEPVVDTSAFNSSPYKLSSYEAHLYSAGVGHRSHGPKLVYRTSKDDFGPPSGPEEYTRLMRIIPVPESHEFGQNGKWDLVRDQVVKLLDQRNIKLTSVDFVRFTWLNEWPAQEIESEEEDEKEDEGELTDAEVERLYDAIRRNKPVEYGERHYTNPTIWIGVEPDSLTGAEAHKSSEDICAYLDSLGAQNIDIAFRESFYRPLSHGPPLFKPCDDFLEPLWPVSDNVSVALSLPIAGYKTAIAGTLGPYFHDGSNLYAITVRHNIFSPYWSNSSYSYHESAPKKEVVLMGSAAFAKYLSSIMDVIATHLSTAKLIDTQIGTNKKKIEDGIGGADLPTLLKEREAELARTRIRIDKLKAFFVEIKEKWSNISDRVIGFVRWAPPIGVGVPPHQYTRDLCVIQLYKNKFTNMIGNVLSLGPELSPGNSEELMRERPNAPSSFNYPIDALIPLKNILTVAELAGDPDTSSLQGDSVRRVLKRGIATKTTVGTLTKFMSYVRHYNIHGPKDSLEMAILSHEKDAGCTFAEAGDSGSLIVTGDGKFVGLLTGGTNKGTDGCDITYATPFEWVWDLVKEEFPGADLNFDNVAQLFAEA
ncbi:hypothetical protein CYLTODRAFT_495169 [Cylindrobasidium torrendii FP15055 ss-10]|uniref:Uncharacterized protein n=1 Tax=Cylindrobasidium torrendii FP15055 ss-10 TaxID=1314674 RepID=A0A0D7ATQ1_9AGAR|nr:hypothetical protein CYLTODRAFT_495169 [Cylindrobasidium torrendii FP15055 ss-10]